MQPVAWSILMLLLVVAAIPLSLWALKRLQTLRPGGGNRPMEVLAQLPLGPRERVVMVRVQGRVLVLGATAQQITLLAETDASGLNAAHEVPAPTAAPAAGFATLLQSLGSLPAPRRP